MNIKTTKNMNNAAMIKVLVKIIQNEFSSICDETNKTVRMSLVACVKKGLKL
jgi:hypothetical protein